MLIFVNTLFICKIYLLLHDFAMSRLQTMSDTIRHNGIIERIDGDTVFVRIIQQSACSACHARGMCSASDSKIKVIEINNFSGHLNVDDEVTICGQSSLGLKAVLLAFVLPLLLIIAVITLCIYAGVTETASAAAGLLILIPYYFVLYLMRDKLKKQFVFTLEKHNTL